MNRILLIIAFIGVGLSSQAQLKSKTAKAKKTLRNATEAIEDIQRINETSIPKTLLQKMEGIVVFPGALKVALGFGGQGGRGFAMIKKKNGQWSNPYFLGMGEGSLGAQIGVQSTDIILLFRDRRDIIKLERTELALGGDIGIAAGPVGRNSSASTDIGFDAEIYSYSRSKGLYAGISLEGTVLEKNKAMNEEFYGKEEPSTEDIFYKTKTPYSKEISDFLKALNAASK